MLNKMLKKILFVITIISIGFLTPTFCFALTEVSNAAELSTAFASGGEIKLTANITATGHLQSSSNSVILNLNGKTLNMGSYVMVALKPLTVKDTNTESEGKIQGTANFIIQIGNSNKTGVFTLESGTIEGYKYGIRNLTGGTLTINGGKVDAPSYTVYNQGKLTMADGYIHASTGLAVQNYTNAELTVDGGKIETEAYNSAINMYGDCKATINGGEIHANYDGGTDDGGIAISMFKNTELTINGGLLSSHSFAVYQNGSLSGGNAGYNAKLNIKGGTLESAIGATVYAASPNGETNISGGTIKGQTAIEVRAGKLTVDGGTFTSNTSNYNIKSNANGSTTEGAAISIAQHDTYQPIDVVINGGTFKAPVAISYTNPLNNAQEHIDKISIRVNDGTFRATSSNAVLSYQDKKILAGGSYNKDISKYVLDGYGVQEETNNEYVVGKEYSVTIKDDSKDDITANKLVSFKGEIVTITPKDKWNFIPVIDVTDSNNNKVIVENNKFTMPNSNVSISVTYEPRYKIISGDDQVFKKDNIVIKTNGSIDDLVSIKVNDVVISKSNYTLKSGSTILELKKSYLKKLSAGSYKITLAYVDGEVSANLSVTGSNPPTKDNVTSYIAISIISLISITSIVIYKNKLKYRL